jgi:hypothetical protein
MFVAVSHTDEKRITIYSSNYLSGFMKLKQVRLPKDAMLSNTFTLMDTSESQVFLFIENYGLESPFGNLYISDEKGTTFTLSMSKVIKGTAVDFEKISALDGTFMINRYNNDAGHSKLKSKQQVREFDESDLISYESKKSKLQRPETL